LSASTGWFQIEIPMSFYTLLRLAHSNYVIDQLYARAVSQYWLVPEAG